MNKTIKVQTIRGKGNSLWGESKGAFHVSTVEIRYLNFIHYPAEAKIHASVTLRGPDTKGVHYTDSGIQKNVDKNPAIKLVAREILGELLAKNGMKRDIPEFNLSWSEWGMQPENGWNFDLGPKK